MTYIKLEDALKPIMKLIEGLERVKETGGKPYSIVLGPVIQDLMQLGIDINSLPSIYPQGIIQEMIEEMRNKEYMYDLDMVKIDALQELLNKLPK